MKVARVKMSVEEVAQKHNTFLVEAIQSNDLMEVEKMLKRGLDPDTRIELGGKKRPIICECALRNRLILVKMLLQAGCNIDQLDSSGKTALHIAARNSHRDMVSLLVHKRAHVNAVTQSGKTPLHLASLMNSLAVVRILVEAGADVNALDHDWDTPLMNACDQQNVAVAGFLLSKNADVNLPNPAGNTALICSLSQSWCHVELLRKLLQAGANVHVQDYRSDTPLHLIIGKCFEGGLESEVAQLLMSHGCDVNAPNSFSHTPLHMAAEFKQDMSALWLVRAGCALDLEDDMDMTPICYAIRQGSRYIVELLLAAGAKFPPEEWRTVDALTGLKDPVLLARLLGDRYECQSLARMCRRSILVHYGVNAQAVIGSLRLPTAIKSYLAYDVL